MLSAPISEANKPQSTTSLGAAEASLGQQDFLRMLIAQLENQDPLNPQESTEFTAQLAQFSSLEQSIAMRSSLDSIDAALRRADSVTAVGMIGQQVLAESSLVQLQNGSATLQFELLRDSGSTKVVVRNEGGIPITEIDAGPLSSGLHSVPWDGTFGPNGSQAPDGVYSIEVVAGDEQGFPVTANTVVSGRVSGADVTGNAPILLLGELVVPLANVREVYEPGAAGGAP